MLRPTVSALSRGFVRSLVFCDDSRLPEGAIGIEWRIAGAVIGTFDASPGLRLDDQILSRFLFIAQQIRVWGQIWLKMSVRWWVVAGFPRIGLGDEIEFIRSQVSKGDGAVAVELLVPLTRVGRALAGLMSSPPCH
jgi:hypothetical protein